MIYISSFLDSNSVNSKGGCASRQNFLSDIEKSTVHRKKGLQIIPLIVLTILLANLNVLGQNAIVGSGFSTGWGGGSCPTGNGNFKTLAAGTATTYVLTTVASGTGDRYFRFGVDWSGTTKQLTNTIGTDLSVSPGVKYSLNTNCTTSGSLVINCPNTTDNYVFKTLNAGTDPTGTWVYFRVQGTVRTISLTSRDITSPTYTQSPTITATMSGALPTGQSVYLRWTTNDFITSTVTEMTGGTSSAPTAMIPSQTTGTTVKYYMFTSGSGLTISGADADLYTINLLNNSGSNYSYTTTGVSRYAVASGNWNETSTWSATSGGSSGATVPIAGDNVIIEGGRTVTVTANAAASSVTFNGTTANTLSVNSNSVLTVSGAVTLNSDANNSTACTISGAGTVNCGSINVGNDITPNSSTSTIMTSTISNLTIAGAGNLTLRCDVSGSAYNNPRFYLNDGTLIIPGQIVPSNVQNNSGQAVRFWMDQGNQSGTLVLTGATPWMTNSAFPNGWGNGGSATWSLILNGTNASVVYNRSGDQTIIPDRLGISGTVTATYTNLTLAGSGNKNLPTNSSITVNGTLSYEGSATITTKAPTFGVGSTLQYKNGSRTTTALEWPAMAGPSNLTIDNSGNTVTMVSGNNRTLTGNLILTAGTLADNGNTLTVNGNILGTATHSGVGKILLNTSGSTISGATFGNLELSNSGGSFSLTGNPRINGTLTLTNGTLTIGATGIVTIGSGGAISRTSGTLAAGTGAGKFSFLGTGAITGTVGFNDVDIANGVNFGSESTINGILSINAGGFVNTNAPTYASGSTLRYNSGGTYGRGTEWIATTGAGYPVNVQVSNNTTLDLSANSGTNTARQCAGNLTIDDGSTITLGAMNQALTVLGKYTNNGTTILSTVIGGDIKLQGDMDDNGTFAANGRAIFFEGSNNQTINSSTNPLDVDVMRIGKSGGEIILAQNLLVDETADPIQFTTANSVLNLSGYNATFGKANTSSTISMNALSKIKSSSSSSSLTILGVGDFGTVYFDQGANSLGNFTINRTGAGNVTLGSNLNISSALTIVSGGIDLGGSVISGGGSFTLPTGATLKTAHTGGLASAIAVTGTKTFSAGANYVFSGNTTTPFPASGTIGNPAFITIDAEVTLNRDITTAGININSAKTLNLTTAADLTVTGNIVNSGSLILADGATLVQSGTIANSGVGTYTAQKALTGSGGSSPSGRFWYTGVPMSGATAGGFSAQGPNNKLWSHSEATGAYTEIDNNTIGIDQGKGYVFRGGSTGTYSFSSNNIGNGNVTYNLTRTSTSAKPGFNLISNPYPSHMSWNDLYATASLGTDGLPAILPTIWYRTLNTDNVMTFDTYNYDGGVGTNNSGTTVTGIIAPFQSFWVRVAPTATSATMTATNAMRSHGTQNFLTLTPAIVRLNLSNGLSHDESIVFVKDDLSNDYDYRDSGKEIPSATVHQLYSLEGTNKVAINGIANALLKDTLQLGLQIPTAGTYSINCTEHTFSDLVYLEDKITDAYIELSNTTTYSFTSEAGTFNNRFVLHFAPVPALPGQTAATAIAMPTSNWPQCNNVTSEDAWHAFTATSEGISIAVNTSTTDVLIELQDGTGNVVAQENAVNGIGNETLNFYGLIAGQTYKVGVHNTLSGEPTGTYGICVKSLKRGGCDYGAGPYSLCQYYKATWAGSTGVSYTFTFTGTSGPATGQTFTRTQNSDICVLSTVTPLLPYGSTYSVVISNTYTLTDGAGNTEQITVPSINGCQVITIAEPQTTLSASNSCNNGPRFRGAVVSSAPWVCGASNWRWRFTEVNPLTLQAVGLPIELNRGAASNFLSLGTVNQLQSGKTYAVQTAPVFNYTGTNYNWGPTQYLCIVGAAGMTLEGADATQGAEQGSTKDAVQDATQELHAVVYVTEGNHVNIQLSNAANNTAKRADIYDVTGKCVKTVRLVEGMNQVELSEASGIYMVRTVVGNQSETARVFIQK